MFFSKVLGKISISRKRLTNFQRPISETISISAHVFRIQNNQDDHNHYDDGDYQDIDDHHDHGFMIVMMMMMMIVTIEITSGGTTGGVRSFLINH